LANIFSECCSIKLQAFPSNLPFPFTLLLSLMTLSPYPPVSPPIFTPLEMMPRCSALYTMRCRALQSRLRRD
jgi:hypothetical protein